MELHNYMEDGVEAVYNDVVGKKSDFCGCKKCKLDVIARALNHLPSKYVVTQRGRVYTKLQEVGIQFKTDIIKEVAQGIEQVKKNPQH